MKFTYISIPKTASRAVHLALDDKSLNNHKPIRAIPDPEGFTFAFMRDPVERIRSWYYSHKQKHHRQIPLYIVDINKWIKKGCQHHWNTAVNPLYQWDFINIKQEIAVDFIGDHNFIYDQLIEICERLDIPFNKWRSIGRTEVKKPRDLKPWAKDRLKYMFPRDFQLYKQIKQDGYIGKYPPSREGIVQGTSTL